MSSIDLYLTTFLEDEDHYRLVEEYPNIAFSSEDYCPTCRKTGTFIWRGNLCTCDCHAQIQRWKHYLAAGIGIPAQRWHWDDYVAEVPERIKKYRDNPDWYIDQGLGLLLWGQSGTGKSMLATLLLKQLVLRGYRCYYSLTSQAVDYYTAGWHGNQAEKEWFERKFKNSQVLLLDDLGKEDKNTLTKTLFDNLLRKRVQAGKPTFITTELTPGELSNRYGSSTMDLLIESSAEITFRGESFRRTTSMVNMESIEARPIF